MIDEARTLELFGYTSDELKTQSNKPIVAVCEGCGKYRTLQMGGYKDLCRSCKMVGRPRSDATKRKLSEANKGKVLSEEHKRKLSEANKGKTSPEETRRKISKALMGHKVADATKQKISVNNSRHWLGVSPSEETRHKLSESGKGNKNALGNTLSEDHKRKISEASKNMSEETRRKISEAHKGKTLSEETRRKLSATRQGISYDDWEGFAQDNPYCQKFNEACRESNRVNYDRRCFLCKKTESENGKRLSVHHVDMNKAQGCDGHTWKLIPVCASCHGKLHSTAWDARITYLLEHVWGR